MHSSTDHEHSVALVYEWTHQNCGGVTKIRVDLEDSRSVGIQRKQVVREVPLYGVLETGSQPNVVQGKEWHIRSTPCRTRSHYQAGPKRQPSKLSPILRPHRVQCHCLYE